MPEPAEELSIVTVLLYYGARDQIDQLATGWRSINCPFHGDAHASGRVNVELNAFKCHGCNMSGDAIKLIRLQENKSFGDAIEFARKVFGQSVKDISRATDKPKQRKPLGRNKWKEILD